MRIAFDYSNALRELALYGSLHSAYTTTPHIHKKSGVGASSVQSDDPSKDNDGNNHDNQSLRPKRNQEYGKNSSEAKSDKDSGKSKNTQTGSGKRRNKKLNTLGGYAGRVMVGDRKQPICIPAGTSKVVIGKTQENYPEDHIWSRQPMMTIYPAG